jgi:hypothetical protein
MNAWSGAVSPSVPAFWMNVGKKSGTTIQALSASDFAWQLTNNDTPLITMLGGGNMGIGKTDPGSKLAIVGLPTYADNAAALAGGLTAGDCYRTSTGILMVTYTP